MRINEMDAAYLEQCRQALSDEQGKSLSESNHWEHVDRPQVHADWDAFYKDFAGLIDTSSPEDEKIQELVERHYRIACRFYRPSRLAYVGMALFYGENADMRDFHHRYHPAMVEFLGQAMSIYAEENL